LIVDALPNAGPFPLHAVAEFEAVGRKPLGDGFVGAPVRKFGGALARQFRAVCKQASIS
jgi:hypothetical protein